MFGQCDGPDKEMTWWMEGEQWRLLVLSLARTLTQSHVTKQTKGWNTGWRNRQRMGWYLAELLGSGRWGSVAQSPAGG